MTKTELSIECPEEKDQKADVDAFLRMKSEFIWESSGLIKLDHMFSGFRCINLVKTWFDNCNGFRIKMRRPTYPVKFGVYLQTNLKEYEHYTAYLLDTKDND